LFFDPDAIKERIRRLWIVEGPTDAAALLSIALDAVGVPSAGGAADRLLALARRIRPDEIAIVADRDQAGQRGAERLRDALMIVAPVRIVIPPDGIKDARAWVVGGADRERVEHAADCARMHRVAFQGGVS
jgi:DNA primase